MHTGVSPSTAHPDGRGPDGEGTFTAVGSKHNTSRDLLGNHTAASCLHPLAAAGKPAFYPFAQDEFDLEIQDAEVKSYCFFRASPLIV